MRFTRPAEALKKTKKRRKRKRKIESSSFSFSSSCLSAFEDRGTDNS